MLPGMDDPTPDLFGLRRLLPESGSHKGTRDCESPDCTKSTREGKPFCSKHIESSPYIRVILAKLAKRDQEVKILEDFVKEIPLNGFFVREALLLLRTKDFTIKAFSRRLDISHKAAERLIAFLIEKDYAKLLKTTRGGRTVRGTGPRDLIDGI